MTSILLLTMLWSCCHLRFSMSNVREILEILKETYGATATALEHEDPLQLLIATILSAQCTDERVNKVTPVLFSRFPTVYELAIASQAEMEEIVRSTGFYRNKARNIIACCQMIVTDFNGEVPSEMSSLIRLPGVARKTANVVLWSAFGKNEGIVVDTHVKRCSFRLGLTEQNNPDKVELDLMSIVPRSDWGNFSNYLIDLGRDTCKARRTDCAACKLNSVCPKRL